MNSQLEGRVIRLEEQIYFQEQTLEGLHEALLRQQEQLDRLNRRLEEREELLRQLVSLLEEGGVHTLPPHSLPERY